VSEYITTEELAEKLKVTRQTISNWRKEGLPFLKLGRAVRFDLDKVKEWIEKKGASNG
jgi:excisionase family DNA binding protein